MLPSWMNYFYIGDIGSEKAMVLEPFTFSGDPTSPMRVPENLILQSRLHDEGVVWKFRSFGDFSVTVPLSIDTSFPLLMSAFQAATIFGYSTNGQNGWGTLLFMPAPRLDDLDYLDAEDRYGTVVNGHATGKKQYAFRLVRNIDYEDAAAKYSVFNFSIANQLRLMVSAEDYVQLSADCLSALATHTIDFTLDATRSIKSVYLRASHVEIYATHSGTTYTPMAESVEISFDAGYERRPYLNDGGTAGLIPGGNFIVRGALRGRWMEPALRDGTFSMILIVTGGGDPIGGDAWFRLELPYCVPEAPDMSVDGPGQFEPTFNWRAVGDVKFYIYGKFRRNAYDALRNNRLAVGTALPI